MRSPNAIIDTVDQIITDGVRRGILHLYTGGEGIRGNQIILKEKLVLNFGSCSYLGLEFDPRLQQASIEAIKNYGTQFSESRAYVSIKLYSELEELLCQIFEAYCVVCGTTTLGHIANIPVIISSADAIITDQLVHNSAQTAVKLVAASGTYTEVIRHNRMDILEDRIKMLRNKYKKVWYLADGIYSMFGDRAPMDELYQLLNQHPSFHIYIDDAHGMSIHGKNGRGFALDHRVIHPKMVVASSLSKAFAAGGGVLVFPDKELARKVRTCGGPLVTGGPLQPAQLGAGVAAAKIHLTGEIYNMQQELQERIKFTNLLLKKYELPVIAENNHSVFFIGVHLPKLGYNLVKRMLDCGYYLNLGIFPAVPMKNTGIRFTITRLHSFSQIEQMIRTLALEFSKALDEEGITYEDIYKAFRIRPPEKRSLDKTVSSVINQALSLKVYHYKSIHEIEKKEWNRIFAHRGTFDWDGLAMLEEAFKDNKIPENNWDFDYILIREINTSHTVMATFVTTTIWKDDMLSPAEVSERVEAKRKEDPYFLTSKVVSTGSLLTEGEHIFIDRASPFWKDAFQLFFDELNQLQQKHQADSIVLRDFHALDNEMETYFIDNGFFKISMPDNHVINDLSWSDVEEFYNRLSRSSKAHFRKQVRKYEPKFEVVVENSVTNEELRYFYSLYENVKNNSLELNTFKLPWKLFEKISRDPGWEILTLRLKSDNEDLKRPVCVVFCFIGEENYIPMIIGMDYKYNREFKVYRQALYQLILRAKSLRKKKIHLGFSADIEKKKFGAASFPVYAFMQLKDSYHQEILAMMSSVTHAAK